MRNQDESWQLKFAQNTSAADLENVQDVLIVAKYTFTPPPPPPE
jgi:hypothetical protein